MRGRKPRGLSLAAHDVSLLEQIARSRILPWFQVQRARLILAIAGGERVQMAAFQMQCDPSTIWRLCPSVCMDVDQSENETMVC
jgi:hypothetical protein